MSAWTSAIAIEGARGRGQDRAAVIDLGDALVIALADGAGGTGGGDVAADAIVAAVVEAAPRRPSWAEVLEALDGDPRLGGGQSTAVVMTVTAAGIRGASVGDSAAWVIRGGAIEDLTRFQQRKPLLGAGAVVNELASGPLDDGTLLVASDGLWNYAPRGELVRHAQAGDPASAVRSLVELVRLRSGGLPDDLAAVLCRAAR